MNKEECLGGDMTAIANVTSAYDSINAASSWGGTVLWLGLFVILTNYGNKQNISRRLLGIDERIRG